MRTLFGALLFSACLILSTNAVGQEGTHTAALQKLLDDVWDF